MSRSINWLRVASQGFIVIIPILAIVMLAGIIVFWGFGIDRLGGNFIVLADQAPVPERRIYGFLAALPAALSMLYALWRLFLMFIKFHTGKLVGTRTIRHLRAFSLFSFLAVLFGFFLSGIMRWAMGVFDNAPLWTHLGFSTTHAAVLFSSAIIYVASHIIEEGYTYKQETEEYV